jgi:hypothetical protein
MLIRYRDTRSHEAVQTVYDGPGVAYTCLVQGGMGAQPTARLASETVLNSFLVGSALSKLNRTPSFVIPHHLRRHYCESGICGR